MPEEMVFNIELQLQTLTDLLEKNDGKAIHRLLAAMDPTDAAGLASLLKDHDQLKLFELLKSDQAAEIVEVMLSHDQTSLVAGLRPEIASDIIEKMDSDDAADVLGDLPADKRDAIYAEMKPAYADKTRTLVAYAQDTAGGMMATEFIALKETLTVQRALQVLRAEYKRLGDERATYVYTVDQQGVLTGVLQLRHLVTHPSTERINQIKVPEVKFVTTNVSKYEVAKLFRRYKYLALPVVDGFMKLVGVITADDVVDLITELSTEEMLKIQGVSTEESRTQPVIKMARRRVSWLSINIFLNVLAASVIAFYSDTLKAVIALAAFLPIISDMSGVSGMQAVAVSIRDLALDRTNPKELWKVLWKESRIGLLNGFILGIEVGVIAYLWKGMPYLGLIVAVSLWFNTILAVCLGSSLPLLLKRFNMDPAIASGPILTTVTDLMGFFIVLTTATHMLPLLTTSP